MKLVDAIYHRRAVREYLDRPVEQSILRDLIDAAIQAPSAMNRQDWAFTVVTKRATLDLISERAKALDLAMIGDNPHLAGLRDHLTAPDFHIFYNAPALIVISATLPDAMAQQDCCLAAQNLMLAAHGRGLGSCWIGLAQAWLNTPEAHDELMMPAGHAAVAPIIVGYPKAPPPAVPRHAPHITWVP
jgi:nitroreductase